MTDLFDISTSGGLVITGVSPAVEGLTGPKGGALLPRGIYDPDLNYDKDDLVQVGNKQWVALTDVPAGNAPAENAFWHLWFDGDAAQAAAQASAAAAAQDAQATGEDREAIALMRQDVETRQGAIVGLNDNVNSKSEHVDEVAAHVDELSANVDTKNTNVNTKSQNVDDKALAAAGSADLAKAYAEQPEDQDVAGAPTGARSALHYAAKAQQQLGLVTSAVTTGLQSISTAISTGVVNINTAVTNGLSTLTAYVTTSIAQIAGYVATAAMIAGVSGVYLTKASANAALAGLANGAIILVYTDESKSAFRTIYQKTAGAFSFQGVVPGAREVYVSSVISPDGTARGSDPNDGFTPYTAKATLGAVKAIATAFCTVYMERGSLWFAEPVWIDWQSIPGIAFRSYGQGPKPRWSGRISLAGVTWTQPDAVRWPRTWESDIALNPYPYNGANAINSSSTAIWQPAAYDESSGQRQIEDCGLARRFSGVTRNDCYDQVESLGGFYCNITGSSTVNPVGVGVTGNSVHHVVRLDDGSNPNGKLITFVDQRHLCGLTQDCTVDELTMECWGSKEPFIFSNYFQNMTPGLWRNVTFKEAGIHGFVGTGICTENCEAYGAYTGSAYANSGGGFHNYRSHAQEGRGRGVVHINAKIGHGSRPTSGFGVPIYSHGSGANAAWPPGDHEFHNVVGLEVHWSGTIINVGVNVRGVKLSKVRAYNVDGICSIFKGTVYDGSVEFSDARVFIRPGLVSTSYLVEDAGVAPKLTLNNSFVSNPNANSFFSGSNSATLGTKSTYTNLVLNNSIVTGLGYHPNSNARRAAFNLTMTKSYFGIYNTGVATPWITGDVITDAFSIIETNNASIDDLRAVHSGIDAAVITGVHRQKFQRTIVDTDFTYVPHSPARTATYSGTPTSGVAGAPGSLANITTNLSVVTSVSRQIKISNIDGAGLDYVGRVTNKNVSTGVIEVSPAPPMAFTGKTLNLGFFNKKLFGSDMTYQAQISGDGLSFKVAGQGGMFTPGMLFRVTNVPSKPWQSLLRKVVSVSGDSITMDKAIPWTDLYVGTEWNTIDGVTVTNRNVTPFVTVSFGFPVWTAQSGTVVRASWSAVFAEGGTAGPIVQSSATLKWAGFDSATVHMEGWRNTQGVVGTQYTSATSPPSIDPATGVVDSGQALATGDVYSIQANVEVRDWRMDGNLAADPALAGDFFFAKNSEYASRLGYISRDKVF